MEMIVKVVVGAKMFCFHSILPKYEGVCHSDWEERELIRGWKWSFSVWHRWKWSFSVWHRWKCSFSAWHNWQWSLSVWHKWTWSFSSWHKCKWSLSIIAVHLQFKATACAEEGLIRRFILVWLAKPEWHWEIHIMILQASWFIYLKEHLVHWNVVILFWNFPPGNDHYVTMIQRLQSFHDILLTVL